MIIEDTGTSNYLPSDKGILTFSTLDEARDRLHDCVSNYDVHTEAARAIAEEYFDSNKVLSRLIAASIL